ncbi:MAG: hypothetical protein FWC34_02905 [Bacteroidetes bacterium]|nr:hypothetical protein [Bacteroidota bacterium]MCL2302825.1 hypothetical protein [Lentimicrobiaceae bacterium]
MKKITIFLIVAIASLGLFAQNAEEPSFIGEALLLNADGTTSLLEKQTVQVTVQSTGFSLHQKMVLNGCCAGIRTEAGKIQLIVRAVDNNSDPLSIIRVIKFDAKKKNRKAELASTGWGGSKSGKMKLVPFTGAKFGTSSYLLTIPNIGPGEYGIIVTNPNMRDEKITVVSCFGID